MARTKPKQTPQGCLGHESDNQVGVTRRGEGHGNDRQANADGMEVRSRSSSSCDSRSPEACP